MLFHSALYRLLDTLVSLFPTHLWPQNPFSLWSVMTCLSCGKYTDCLHRHLIQAKSSNLYFEGFLEHYSTTTDKEGFQKPVSDQFHSLFSHQCSHRAPPSLSYILISRRTLFKCIRDQGGKPHDIKVGLEIHSDYV